MDKVSFIKEGIITKALSGFYYVESEGETVECRARGRFRADKIVPMVGDRVKYDVTGTKGIVTEILPRKNVFVRPPVANIDVMVIVASAVIPVTDPFLIDRVTALAENCGCACVVCINKCDIDRGDRLYDIYKSAGYTTIRTSAKTGEGIEELRQAIAGKICAFTGNSGVGKSSILNALSPGLVIKTGEVSDKLGRGRHTTRHVELFKIAGGAVIADTPGFSSFDIDQMELVKKEALQFAFPDFVPYASDCRFTDCSHIKEQGCAVLKALEEGKINKTRHESYVRLYEQAKNVKEWEVKDRVKHSELNK